MATIEIGYNRRTWVTFAVKNATPEEIATLEGDDDQTFTLLRKMETEGRLEIVTETYDDNPDRLSEHGEPGLIEVNPDEEALA